MPSPISKYKTIGYLILTAALALWQGFAVMWIAFALWGLLMAAWEQPTHHWARSIFKKWGWDQKTWDATISWKKVTKVFGKVIPWDDSFHVAKSLSIILVCFVPLFTPEGWRWYHSLAAGWVTVESFNLFYNYLLDTEN